MSPNTERDFMGLDWKAFKEEKRRYHYRVLPSDESGSASAFYPGSKHGQRSWNPWPPPSKMAAFEAKQRSFEEIKRRCAVDWNRQFSPWSKPDARTFSMASYHDIPTTASSCCLKGYGIPSIAKRRKQPPPLPVADPASPPPAAPSMLSKSNRSQMTIFYRGRVSVYENIPIEKAQEIMFLAANWPKISFNTPPMDAKAPELPSQGDMNKNPLCARINRGMLCSNPSSPESITSHSVPFAVNRPYGLSGSSSSSSSNGLIPTAQQSSDLMMERALPMARKASLARFFQMRRHRIKGMAPYLTDQKHMQIGVPTKERRGCGKSSESNWCRAMHKSTPCFFKST